MKALPLVTIGIPTYNRPELLRDAIQRVISQTYKNLEIIISDNASINRSEILKIKDDFKNIHNIEFYIQDSNLGFIKNTLFLLNKAKGELFMWVADDDILHSTFVEKNVTNFLTYDNIAISTSNWKVVDMMQNPPIKKDMNYASKLCSNNTYKRLKNYIRQPDYYEKARILWGLIRTDYLKQSFADSLDGKTIDENLTMSALPIEFYLLMLGDLKVVDEYLIEFALLPTSEGLKESLKYQNHLIKLCKITFNAYRIALRKSHLSIVQIIHLKQLLYIEQFLTLARIIPFYTIQKFSPKLARQLKIVWTKLLVSN